MASPHHRHRPSWFQVTRPIAGAPVNHWQDGKTPVEHAKVAYTAIEKSAQTPRNVAGARLTRPARPWPSPSLYRLRLWNQTSPRYCTLWKMTITMDSSRKSWSGPCDAP